MTPTHDHSDVASPSRAEPGAVRRSLGTSSPMLAVASASVGLASAAGPRGGATGRRGLGIECASGRRGDRDDEALEQALRGAGPEVGDGAAVAAAVETALQRAEVEGLVDVAYATVSSPIGELLVAATAAGLVRLAFPGEDDAAVLEELARRIAPRVVASARRLDPVRRELDEYFDGRRDHFDVALDWRLSSGFRRTVLEHLHADVPYGRTVSYLELATLVGNPKASRAVGTAMATNPIPIVVPCHRVLRTGGHLGGYGGGLETKVKLLALESGERPLF